jgi:hypothetical protein
VKYSGFVAGHRRPVVATLTAFAVLLFGVAGPAYAQSGGDGYEEEGPAVQGELVGGSGDGGSGAVAGEESGAARSEVADTGASGTGLPFTGASIAWMTGAAALLLAFGFALHRVTRTDRTS